MNTASRTMYRWLDQRGKVMAELQQGISVNLAGAKAIYIAVVSGQAPVVKNNFACAKRVIDRWIQQRGLAVTIVPGGSP